MTTTIEAHQLRVADDAVADLRNREARLRRDRAEVLRQYDVALEDRDERTMLELAKLRVELEASLAECPGMIEKAERRLAAAVFTYKQREETR